MKKIDLINKTFGDLLVVDFAYNRNNKNYFLCQCNCGNTSIVPVYRLASGKTKSCGCRKTSSQRSIKKSTNPWFVNGILQKGLNPFFRRCAMVKGNAKKKNLCFELDGNYIEELFNRQNGLCYFSHIPLSLDSNSQYSMSIDRLNSKIGYTKENSVLVCRSINYLKACLTPEETFKFIKDIVDYS